MARALEGVCRTRQRMYRVSVTRDGGAKGITEVLVWGLRCCVHGIVV